MTQVLPPVGGLMKNSFATLLFSFGIFSSFFSPQVFAQDQLHVRCREGWEGDPDELSDSLLDINVTRSGDVFTIRSVQSKRRHYEFRFRRGFKDGQAQWTMIMNTWIGECLLVKACTSSQQKQDVLDHVYFDRTIEGAPFEYGISGDLTIVNSLQIQCHLTVVR